MPTAHADEPSPKLRDAGTVVNSRELGRDLRKGKSLGQDQTASGRMQEGSWRARPDHIVSVWGGGEVGSTHKASASLLRLG